MTAQPPSSLLILDIERMAALPVEALAQALSAQRTEVLAGEDAHSALAPNKPFFSYIVVDIGSQGTDIIPFLQHLAQHCHAHSAIVVVGGVNDLGFYRAIRAAGIHEYFNHPVHVDELREALKQANPLSTSAKKNAGGRREGKVVAFIGAASGDGSSTVAQNTAYAIASETRQPTALVDLDYQFGMIARHLDLQAPFGLRELFEFPERGVDATLVSKMLLPYGEHLRVIAAPEGLRMLPAIPAHAMREFIAVLKSQFNCVVLDVPHVWLPWTAEALQSADRIIITAQLWLRSLTHLSRMTSAWQENGISLDNVLLAINRSGARYREAITPQDFERVSLKPINFYLANDIKTLVNAENQGKTVIETGNSLLERQIRDMSRAIYASMTGDTSRMHPAAAAHGPVKGLIGRLHKKG